MKRIIITSFIIIVIFIGVTLASSLMILNGDKILRNFSLISVDNISYNYQIRFESAKAASYYEVIIYDTNNAIFYNKKTNDTSLNMELTNIQYDSKYKIIVYAYDKLGDSIAINNPYTFTYTEPTFSSDNNIILDDNSDYILKINGDLNKRKYEIIFTSDNQTLKKDQLTTNEYTIPKDLYEGKTEKLNVKIYDDTNIINELSLYNKINPVGEVKISNPINDTTLDYNDVALNYEGGNNATRFKLQIFSNDKLMTEKKINKNRCVISSDFFKKAQKYTFKVVAQYKETDYKSEASVNFIMNEKDTLKPAYINTYYKYVRKDTNIILSNPNGSGDIYYTTDGSDPAVTGIKYEYPIIASNNMTIKSIIKEENKNDSVVSNFNINIGAKSKYVVFLSPSNQINNKGVASVGYTNERAEMNDLSNYIENKLESKNVTVIRNNPNGNINLWNSESKYYGADLHIAIHSNASVNHNTYGIETWINEQTSQTFSLANLIQNSLMSLYYKENNDGNRGVKYANGAFGEVNELYVPFGILVEVAHHDYKSDAQWIMVNKRLIGETIANTILTYFGLS